MDIPATILIADTTQPTGLPDTLVLQNAGYRVLHAHSGTQCLQMALENKPELILIGLHLPDMSGEMVCHRIKADPHLQSTHVLLLFPATATNEEQSRLAAADSDGYISLPIQADELLVRVKSTLQIGKMSEQSRSTIKDYREMLETSPVPYQSLDTNGCLVQVNRAWLDALGYEDEREVLGRSFGDFLDPEGKKLFPERFKNFKATGRVCCIEFEMRRKDNTPLWVSFDGRIARDDKGAFKQTHCMFRDISTQKKLEQEKRFRPEAVLRPYFQIIALGMTLCVLTAGIYILGFHDLNSPLVPMGLAITAGILALTGGLFFLAGRHIRKMILFYLREVDKREQSLKQLNENLGATVDQKTQALSESEKKYRRYIEASPLALFVTDYTGRYMEVNPAASRLLGYTSDEYLQRRIRDLMPSDQRSHVIASFKKIRRTGTTSGEYLLKHKNGSPVHVSIDAVTLAGTGYMAFCQDISKRKKMEKDILRSKRRLEALVKLGGMAHAPLQELTEFSLETVVSLTESTMGFLAFVNEDETILTMHSWSQKAMQQCTMKNAVTTFKAEDAGMWTESLRSREPYICNQHAPSKQSGNLPEGHIPIVRHMNIPITDKGRITVIAGVANKSEDYDQTDIIQMTLLMQGMWDILKHRQAEETIRSSEERLRITLNSIGDGVMATDIQGRVLTMNPVAEHLTGWLLHEARGKHLTDIFNIIHARTRESFGDPVKKITHGGQAEGEANQTLLLSRKGAEYQIAHSGAPIRDVKDTITGVVLVFRDVTEEYRTREELQKMHKLESIGTLAGGIAHDFNNILMGLFGYIELAMNRLSTDHPAHASLARAEQSLDRAVRLSKQLLTFAKGGTPLKENVELAELVEEVAQFDLSGSSVKPVFNIADNLWKIDADRSQMQQIFSNLTINAKQAMPDGGHMYIVLENANMTEGELTGMPPGKYVKITISDEGSGIDPKNIEHIFDPYFSTKNTGSGLGLATVYAIIQKHAGHITVSSHPGIGTTFTLHLPASDSRQEPPKEALSPSNHDSAHPARILIMDDEEMVRQVMTDMLQSLGYTTDTAPDGRHAITMYEQAYRAGSPFDAVIMDLTIPGGMGGKEAVKGILDIDPAAKVIVSSGYADDPVMAEYTRYGFMGIAVKPYSQQKLQELMGRILEVPQG